MNELALGIAILAASILHVAYLEFKSENHRDGGLLVGLGASGTMASAGLYFL